MTEGLQSKESKEAVFQAQLNKILERKITVETIDSYMDRSVDELIALTDEIVADYQDKNPDDAKSGKELEDAAYAKNGLADISEFLGVAGRKIAQLNDVDDYINSRIKTKPEIITPPDITEGPMRTGSGYEKPDIKHRLKALLYILKEHSIDFAHINVVDGVMREHMVRELSYVSIAIPELNRLALVCDEEGNASYIFDLKKLEAQGVSIDAMDRMSKEERKHFIEQNPGVGVRFAYSINWMERAEDLLFNDLEDDTQEKTELPNKGNMELLPKAATNELDPWKGFWTDPEGKHWSNLMFLSQRLGVNRNIIEVLIKNGEFDTKKIIGISRRETDSFCYEDMAKNDHINDLRSAPDTEKGEWRGFVTDEQGRHWGGQGDMAEKLGISRNFIKKYYTEADFEIKKIRTQAGGTTDAICYEDLIDSKEVKDFLAAPRVEKEGEWKGFFTDEHGMHWGGLITLTEKLGIKREGLTRLIGNGSFEQKRIKPRSGPATQGYCFEAVSNDEHVKEVLAAPRVEKEGEWKGFFTDEHGMHWGSRWTLSEKIGISDPVLGRIIDQHGDLFISRNGRDMSDIVRKSFCYESLVDYKEVNDFLDTPKIEKEGEWKGFWTGIDGKHYGTLEQVGLRVGHDRETIDRIAKKEHIKNIKIIDGAGRIGNGYAYEDFL